MLRSLSRLWPAGLFLTSCLSATAFQPVRAAGNPGAGESRFAVMNEEKNESPRLFIYDAERWRNLRDRVRTDRLRPAERDALDRLRAEAEAALAAEPVSVTAKTIVPPSGDNCDYVSQGPYWWPDPDSDSGLPYIRRDGERNPEAEDLDRYRLFALYRAVMPLALAYYYFGDERHAERAAKFLRVWFLREESRMNPHLEYGQRIPGVTEGRGTGIIETRLLVEVLEAVGLLENSEVWSDADAAGMREWFADYLAWLRTSEHGRESREAENNHGVWHDVQVVSFALFVGENELARQVLAGSGKKRIASQIEPDGRMPRELARAEPFRYSHLTLRAFFDLADLAKRVDIGLWNFQTDDGRSVRDALDFLAKHAERKSTWPYADQPDWGRLAPLLRRAAITWEEPAYESLRERLPPPARPGVEELKIPHHRIDLLYPMPSP